LENTLSAFDIPVSDVNEGAEQAKNILREIEALVPAEKMEALRGFLNTAMEEEFNAGYRVGVTDAESRMGIPGKNEFNKGEAKGLAWAYHAVNGRNVAVMDNPIVREGIVQGLLEIGKAKQEQDA
jgi:hypothetical protein